MAPSAIGMQGSEFTDAQHKEIHKLSLVISA